MTEHLIYFPQKCHILNSFSQILAYSASNDDLSNLFASFTSKHENEAKTGNYYLGLYFNLFMRKNTCDIIISS